MPGDSSRTRAASGGDKVAISGNASRNFGTSRSTWLRSSITDAPWLRSPADHFPRSYAIRGPAASARAPTTAALLQLLDDAQVAHRAVAECLQRVLVGRAVMRRDGFFHAGEFGDDDALLEARLVGRRGGAAREIAAAERRDRRRRELGVSGKLVGIGDYAIARDPVAFGHGSSVEVWRARHAKREDYRRAG